MQWKFSIKYIEHFQHHIEYKNNRQMLFTQIIEKRIIISITKPLIQKKHKYVKFFSGHTHFVLYINKYCLYIHIPYPHTYTYVFSVCIIYHSQKKNMKNWVNRLCNIYTFNIS